MAAGAEAEPFEILEHTADIGLRARGRTLEELFENAAWGLAEILDRRAAMKTELKDSDQLREGWDFSGVMASADIDALLVDFLNEVLWYLELEPPPRCLGAIRVYRAGPPQLADAALGAEIEYQVRLTECHQAPEGTELKAATYHQLAIRQTSDGFEATVYFDV